jgi:hypothetical protein
MGRVLSDVSQSLCSLIFGLPNNVNAGIQGKCSDEG